ncbi:MULTISPECIES: CopG family ribbon-helix-helix protein [Nostoc]|uniref:CopG family ribbon-helix-helix protein n=1 Tax=Nostoc TaxID=1177 RepID=UPI001F5580D1|nr:MULTISPECIES: CopG family transcriptional regulator [Nostoc]
MRSRFIATAIAATYILNETVATYLEIYQWQIEEIQKGIAEADAGDFADDEEVKATFARLTNAY